MDKVRFLMSDTGAPFTAACREALEQKGVDVTVVEKDGNKVLQKMLTVRPQVVLLDAFMPGLDAQTRLGELSEILAEQAKQGKADTEQYMQKHESTIKSMQRYYTSPKTSDKSTGNSSSETVTQEYKNALTKGLQYANQLHMSKKAIYDQLTSSYGEGFPADAAQYAIDNMTGVDWNANALAKAQEYYTGMSMSKSAVYDQLTSEYGEQFTTSEAQYAIDHLN